LRKAEAREWAKIEEETEGINDKLDKVFRKKGPAECHNYIRQRKRQPVLTHRGRITYRYDGKPHQAAAYRLAYIRHHGRIEAGLDVAHICEKNGNCGNPNHLIALPRSSHRKFDKSMSDWLRAIRALCPTAKSIYGLIPDTGAADDCCSIDDHQNVIEDSTDDRTEGKS